VEEAAEACGGGGRGCSLVMGRRMQRQALDRGGRNARWWWGGAHQWGGAGRRRHGHVVEPRGGGGRARECLTGVEARFGWGEPGVRLLVEPWVQVMDP
jgi:hypothetical protein